MIFDERAEELAKIPWEKIRERMEITGKAKRWERVPHGDERFGSLLENLTANAENESLPESRLKSDWLKLKEIKAKYGIE